MKSSVLKILVVLGSLGLLTATVFLSGYLEQDIEIDRVILEIDYYANWNATFTNTIEYSLSGFGKNQMTLVDISKEGWIVTVRAQKQDDSMMGLVIRIKLTDGTVIGSASTFAPYGTAVLTVIVR